MASTHISMDSATSLIEDEEVQENSDEKSSDCEKQMFLFQKNLATSSDCELAKTTEKPSQITRARIPIRPTKVYQSAKRFHSRGSPWRGCVSLLTLLGVLVSLGAMVALYCRMERSLALLRIEVDDLWVRQRESVQEQHNPPLPKMTEILQEQENDAVEYLERAKRNVNQSRRTISSIPCSSYIPKNYASFKLNKNYFSNCLATKTMSDCRGFGYHESNVTLNITNPNNPIPWAFNQPPCRQRREFYMHRSNPFNVCVSQGGTYLILTQISVMQTPLVSLQMSISGTAVRQCKGYGANLFPRVVCAMSHVVKLPANACISLITLQIPLAIIYSEPDTNLQLIRLAN